MLVRFLVTSAGFLFFFSSVSAHHSDAGIDMESVIALQGVVTDFNWRNPHVYVTVSVADSGDAEVEWSLQMGTANGLTRRGWSRDSLKPGDRVTVRAHASEDRRPYAIIESIDREGGLALAPLSAEADVNARADSLTGNWLADASKLIAYPGGYDGFFSAQLVLTDAARAAQAAYDPLGSENPESTCDGRATPAAIVSSRLYMLQFEIIEAEEIIKIRSEYFDEERTIYMDGRDHPDPSELLKTGHSVGRWEDDVLVVDTTNFIAHRSPYQIGIPAGNQKHVIERYQLIEDGARMAVEFILEDPEYLAEPLLHSRELVYSPHMTMFQFDCDPDATSRFLRD